MQSRTEESQFQRVSKKTDIFGSICNQMLTFLNYRNLKSIRTVHVALFIGKLVKEASVFFSHGNAFLKCRNSAIQRYPGKSFKIQSKSGKNNNHFFFISDQHAISQ